MKYPKLRSEWIPVENPAEKGITHQIFKSYINGELAFEKHYDLFQNSAEFFIPAWDVTGKLLVEPSTITTTVQAISYNFPSDIIMSEPMQLSGIGIDNPSNLEVFVMPFPENFQDYEVPVVPNSGVI
jgi:hypothetical protein|tara:strand:+ start:94 stop:474 length:381 start_codon:yes stop_codon:yes gene_type:complete